MATMAEQPKATSVPQEHPYPVVLPFPHQGFNGGPYPPPGAPGVYPPPPYFAYPPPAEGMMYAYPPPQGQAFPPPANQTNAAISRPKRKQVKMACTNCAAACKRCDEHRPCERCIKYGISESCVDGQRKERKKGIKRGPYKRKNKSGSDGEWAPTAQTPPSTATTTAAIHAVAAHQYPPPEGYYPTMYYSPPAFIPPTHDGQPGPDGSPPHPNGQPPMMPYYIHPGGYPYPHYPPMYPMPGAPPPQPQQQQQSQSDPQVQKPGEVVAGETNGTDTNGPGKKRARAPKNGEPRPKKPKTGAARAGKDKEDEGDMEQGVGGEGNSAE
ncbi:hypothetical protein BDQ12DRAFT_124445 [Crucibulum laeve]|uniref:Transcription activator of gluconeogenesis ERT1 n=1 Tax=Crucibulum laeve TaxID=68775 RepID=A0A5C3LYI1_9AGAR|nr:hypothetical protein BDQ12DRAFT_124445 [Crucibulum laeve]